MASPQPEFKKPKKEATSEVTVPRLGEKETQRRAELGFDISVAKLLKENFTKPPPKPEMDTLKKMVTAITKTGEDVDLNSVVDQFISENPGSTIEKYYRAGGNDPACFHKNGRIEFNLKALHASLKEYLTPVKTSVVSNIIALSNPEVRGRQIDMSQVDGTVLTGLHANLALAYTSGKTRLPIEIKLEEKTLTLLSLLAPPVQQMDFSEDG